MKNLLDYGVQELSIKEKVEIDGGWTTTRKIKQEDGTYQTVVRYWRWNNGRKENYLTQVDGKFGGDLYD